MKKIPLLILLVAIFFGCKEEDNVANLSLNFRNEMSSDLGNIKVYFMENYNVPHDTLVFDLLSQEEKNINYEYEPKGGKGEYILLVGAKKISFGYYPSTLAKGDNVFYFKIKEDTVLISQRTEGFW